MAMTLQLMSMLDIFTLDLTLQQMINNPLQLPTIQRPNNFNPSPGPDLGLGHWSNGAYFEGNNIIMPGGASLIDGELFIPD